MKSNNTYHLNKEKCSVQVKNTYLELLLLKESSDNIPFLLLSHLIYLSWQKKPKHIHVHNYLQIDETPLAEGAR